MAATTDKRADPFADDLDLSEFKPTVAAKPKIEKAAARQASEANNFSSRAATAKPPTPATDRQQRRRRTGRNVQFNIKATPETIARFAAVADKNGWVFGETLDRALDALEPGLCSSLYVRLPAAVIGRRGRRVSSLKNQVWARNSAAAARSGNMRTAQPWGYPQVG
jgi:hypothetical protein